MMKEEAPQFIGGRMSLLIILNEIRAILEIPNYIKYERGRLMSTEARRDPPPWESRIRKMLNGELTIEEALDLPPAEKTEGYYPNMFIADLILLHELNRIYMATKSWRVIQFGMDMMGGEGRILHIEEEFDWEAYAAICETEDRLVTPHEFYASYNIDDDLDLGIPVELEEDLKMEMELAALDSEDEAAFADTGEGVKEPSIEDERPVPEKPVPAEATDTTPRERSSSRLDNLMKSLHEIGKTGPVTEFRLDDLMSRLKSVGKPEIVEEPVKQETTWVEPVPEPVVEEKPIPVAPTEIIPTLITPEEGMALIPNKSLVLGRAEGFPYLETNRVYCEKTHREEPLTPKEYAQLVVDCGGELEVRRECMYQLSADLRNLDEILSMNELHRTPENRENLICELLQQSVEIALAVENRLYPLYYILKHPNTFPMNKLARFNTKIKCSSDCLSCSNFRHTLTLPTYRLGKI
jgi:hypothetical protein